jgi:DNA segregation ATPase FtsK/SpoIIIE, S-DNA-T family
MRSVFKRFRTDVAIVVVLAFTVFFNLSLASYSALDPSFSSTGHGIRIRNLCGIVGSFVADGFYQIFGISAWFIAISAIVIVYLALRNRLEELRAKLTLGLTALILICAVVGLHFPDTRFFNGQVTAAGAVGLGVSTLVTKGFNVVGAAVVLWSTLLITLIALTQISLGSLKGVFKKPTASIGKFFLFLANQFQLALVEIFSQRKKLKARIATPAPIMKPQSQPMFVLNQHEVEDPSVSDDKSLPPVPDSPRGYPPIPNNEKFRDLEIDTMASSPKKLVPRATRVIENWELPKLSLLLDPPASRIKVDEREIRATTSVLEEKLAHFSIGGHVTAVRPGPAVTMFEFKPDADVRIARITELADDLALALSSESIRIIAPVPGRDVVGIETANSQREKVYLKDNLTDGAFWDEKIKLPVVLGKQATGAPKVVDLRKMPHLLVAGTTGSGKSVFVVSVLTSLLFRHSPKTLRLILVDPKQVDLAAFQKVPHLLMPLVNDPRKAVNSLKWAIQEMEKRYRSMSRFGARGIEEFNDIAKDLTKTQREEHDQINHEMEQLPGARTYYFAPQPYIVIVVEEFADLMSVDRINVEQAVVRLAQMARASGIHLILAVQSPRRDVVTGLIKTNIPGRISFKVASKLDSRIILDDSGAERLLANGDMLFHAPGVSRPERHHGAWLSEEEINRLTKFWSDQAEPVFDEKAMKTVENNHVESEGFDGMEEMSPESEERYDEILAYVSEQKEVSASLLQRKFRLGYPRAARMIEIFEKEGIVGPANGSKPRQVLTFRET